MKCYKCKYYKEYYEEYTLIENECIKKDLFCFNVNNENDCNETEEQEESRNEM
jgi:hypothetical protein